MPTTKQLVYTIELRVNALGPQRLDEITADLSEYGEAKILDVKLVRVNVSDEVKLAK
jgi:hypothetical protein